eukprot:TRINITY_DN103742_c0_g1_i1.p1 TRINITY_DN103742_c0_g1~~TRINITY_DN103742_c0_g1_i1.p1  ORF type:complete len:555 (+),score=106.23 TRINITY_DN103742_c0_g1_i1:24-1688(+)
MDYHKQPAMTEGQHFQAGNNMQQVDYRNTWSTYRSKREASRQDVVGKLSSFLQEHNTGAGRKQMLLMELRSAESEHCEEQDRLHDELSGLNVEVENLRTEVSQSKERINFQQSELQSNVDTISKLRKKMNELELEYREQQRTYEQRCQQLEDELNVTTQALTQTQKQIEQQEQELAGSRNTTTTAQHELRILNEEIQRLREAEDRWLKDLERSAMRPVVGIEVREQKSQRADGSSPSTLVVAALAKGGAAEKAGVQVGDVITRFDKLEIHGKPDFAKAVLCSTIGGTVFIQVQRTSTLPNGKVTTSVDHIPLVVAGARPTGIDVETLRRADDPELFVKQSKEKGNRALAAALGTTAIPTTANTGSQPTQAPAPPPPSVGARFASVNSTPGRNSNSSPTNDARTRSSSLPTWNVPVDQPPSTQPTALNFNALDLTTSLGTLTTGGATTTITPNTTSLLTSTTPTTVAPFTTTSTTTPVATTTAGTTGFNSVFGSSTGGLLTSGSGTGLNNITLTPTTGVATTTLTPTNTAPTTTFAAGTSTPFSSTNMFSSFTTQ